MTTSPRSHVPHVVMTVLIVIWSASYVSNKEALGSLSPPALLAIRFTLAGLCLLPFLRGPVRRDFARSWRAGVATGVVLAAGYLLQMAGMTETSASTGGLLAGLIVPLVALGGFVFFRARLGPLALAGLVLALAGIAAICMPATPAGDGAARDTLRGILLQVGSSIAYAGHILLLSRFGRSAPIVAFSLWQLAVVAGLSAVFALVEGRIAAAGAPDVVWDARLVGNLLYLAVFATAVGIGVQSKVQHRVPPTPLALLFALQPLFAALFGWALLDDRLGALQLAGGATIVAGVVITSLERPRRPGGGAAEAPPAVGPGRAGAAVAAMRDTELPAR
jgi:drug/metabolite transporter (DMT)-like permease